MKTFLTLLCTCFIICPFGVVKSQDFKNEIRVMTYNIKYDDKNDTINNWNWRKNEVVRLINYYQPHLIGTQEGLYNQLEDIKNGLLNYDYVGIGRDGEKGKGEYSAIFYNTDEFELLESHTFWLSEKPDQMKPSWDAAFPRICTWARLKDKRNGQTLLYFNTHFDHIGQLARLESAKLICSKIDELKDLYKGAKVILSGDFNSTPDSEPYHVLIDKFTDSQLVSKSGHFGPEATFNGFNFDEIPERRIDYIFIGDEFEVLNHATLTNSNNMKYPSDHFPVMATLKFKN